MVPELIADAVWSRGFSCPENHNLLVECMSESRQGSLDSERAMFFLARYNIILTDVKYNIIWGGGLGGTDTDTILILCCFHTRARQRQDKS